MIEKMSPIHRDSYFQQRNTKVVHNSILFGPKSDFISEYRKNRKKMVLLLDERLFSKVEVTE